MQTSPPAKCLIDTAASPFPAKTKQLRSPRKLSIPLTREEEEYYTKLTKPKMNESANKSTVRCKIKGQPLIYKNVLKKNKITMQAYHGHTFVGNHCHKYLQPSVTHDVCQSVVVKTFQLSDDVEVQKKAHDIASKYQILNELFTRVHKSTAHALPTAEEEINNLDSDIIRYMDFYRSDIA